MSVLIYTECHGGQLTKSAFEAATYGKRLAESQGKDFFAVVLGPVSNINDLGAYGISKVYHVGDQALSAIDSQVYSAVLAEIARDKNADTIVLSHSSTGKSIAGRLSVKLKAGLVSGVNTIPDGSGVVSKSVYSGKAIAKYKINSAIKIYSVMANAITPEKSAATVSVEKLSLSLPASKIKVTETKRAEGTVPLPEAELVVSGGRGFKGPENWGILTDLAEVLGASTACSRPVADAHWRPHNEHVGQTGIAIRPKLYIAIGISGAIQHLAGVNNSKVIVVINKDPEAPFFKAADYGVLGDLFDIVPRLTEAIRKFKAGQH